MNLEGNDLAALADRPAPPLSIEERVRRSELWIGQMDDSLRRVKRHALGGLATLATNVVVAVGFALSHARSTGIAEEHAAAVERSFADYRIFVSGELARIDRELSYLRTRVDKLSGVDTKPPTGNPMSDIIDLFPPPITEEALLCARGF